MRDKEDEQAYMRGVDGDQKLWSSADILSSSISSEKGMDAYVSKI
jgi:hypothetical protein